VIEDDLETARLLELELGRAGYQTIAAQDGLQGLRIAQANLPDLVLLDLMLPGLDGFEVLSHLRAEPRTTKVPVVILSAKSHPTDRQMAIKAGADAYMIKPHSHTGLLEVIRSLVSERSERKAAGGIGVTLVEQHSGKANSVALYVGLALSNMGMMTTVVDFHPLSIEHPLLLDIPHRPTPISLFTQETQGQLTELMIEHASGLRLLHNLHGRGEAGQITPDDAQVVFDVLLAGEGFVLADVPLYPADVLRYAASRCAQVLLVTQANPALLASVHTMLTVIEQASVDKDRISFVLVGLEPGEQPLKLGRAVLGTIPVDAGPGHPAFHDLADQLRQFGG
jgi:CheY-like chemotaxis protein